ncbi:putative PIG3 family NAD(P)H quinone oxidoreductase [Mumia flava]|uniref:Putative PIG3 family NAD(P)H quinone oxidoreductase n=1 Tax=Mumia flava TaxID=1348852 RepID=A0A0B2BBI8_9ACTN|nr:NAD(P)H-quinone oxidoreductase [Mumia flava]PJJ57511.1 putative PIG3 family NAD(P)H quinone oxidoreductase [Mumia flava]
MRAVVVEEPGGPEQLRVVERPIPEPGPDEVVLDVVAAGVNRADVLQRQGFYPPPKGATDVLGLECSGVVRTVGADVTRWRPGDPVVALLSAGGYAEQVAVPEGQLAPLPDGMDPVQAGGLMETAATVWSNVFMLGDLQPGETLLVHGGASGIGTTAIQMGKAFGATVVATAGSDRKVEACRMLGADVAINYREADFVEEVAGATEGRGADVILDIVGAKYLPRNVEALAVGGRIVVIGMQGGTRGELDLSRLLAKRGSVAATSLRARPAREKAGIVAELVESTWPLYSDETLVPVVDTVLGLDDVAAAHRILDDSGNIGKVVLTP